MENSVFIKSTRCTKTFLVLFLILFLLAKNIYLQCFFSFQNLFTLVAYAYQVSMHCKVKGSPLQKTLFEDKAPPKSSQGAVFMRRGKSPLSKEIFKEVQVMQRSSPYACIQNTSRILAIELFFKKCQFVKIRTITRNYFYY